MLLASATASGSTAAADVQQVIAEIHADIVPSLRIRMARDVDAGILPFDTDGAALTGMVMAIIQNM